MVYYTGDIHGNPYKICDFISSHSLTSDDIIVILGDAGINYHGNDKGDKKTKKTLNKYEIPILCIHGNHEMRPETLNTYAEMSWHDGSVYQEENFPFLLLI